MMESRDSDLLLLSWNKYENTVSSAFRRYLTSQAFCNVSVSAEGKTVRCHQEILAASSPWFESVLAPLHTSQHPIIVLKDVLFCDLEDLVGFIYSGEAVVSQQRVQSFLHAGKLLQVNGLEECNKKVKSSTKPGEEEEEEEEGSNNAEVTVTPRSISEVPTTEGEDANRETSPALIKESNTPPPTPQAEESKRKSPSLDEGKEPPRKKRPYESGAPVYDNRHIIQTQLDYTGGEYEIPNDDLIGIYDDLCPVSGVEDCGAFKKVWSQNYLCYNLGKEILCLICFCRFTQFKKFNLERHMRNKHPQYFHLEEEAKKRVLDMYVARYEENVTPGMVARVPTQGNQNMAAQILQVEPLDWEASPGEEGGEGEEEEEDLVEREGLLECHLASDPGDNLE